MKKKKRFDMSIVLQLILGAFLGAGISEIFIMAIKNSKADKPVVYNLLFIVSFIFIYYVSVIIHELTHFFTFIKYGTEMRLLVMGPFIFIKEENKWNFKFKFTTTFALGGIAMPNLGVIDNDEKMEAYRKAFAKVLVAAPLSNIVLNILVVVICAISYRYAQSELLRSYIVFVGGMTTIISIFLNLSSLIKNDLVIGDYRAYYEALKEPDFSLVCAYQYLITSDKYNLEDKKYLKEKILVYLNKEFYNKSFNTYTVGILDFMVNDYLTGKEEELPKIAEDYINFLSENCEDLLKAFPNKEHPLILLHHIILYYCNRDEYKEKAETLYNKISSLVKHKTPVLRYYDLRSKHVLGVENNLNYITKKENIKTSSLYELFSMFSWYYKDETKILDKLNH